MKIVNETESIMSANHISGGGISIIDPLLKPNRIVTRNFQPKRLRDIVNTDVKEKRSR